MLILNLTFNKIKVKQNFKFKNKILATIIFLAAISVSLMACKPKSQNSGLGKEQFEIEGNYVDDSYALKDEGYDWVAVIVNELSDSLIQISIRSRADKKQPTCTFDSRAVKVEPGGYYQTVLDGNSILFEFLKDTLVIREDTSANYSNLNYFCSGGASIAGVYKRIIEPLDDSQIDKVIFRKSLNYLDYHFFVEVYNKMLSIEPFGLSIDKSKVIHNIEGRVVNAETGDLNIDGFPEVIVYIQSDGSGSYGSIIGYSVNNGKSMSQFYLPDISENKNANQGYMGHDEFAIVENTLVRRFPIYNPGDSNVSPTGGTRQLQYKLVDGEASRKLIIDKIVEY